MNRPYIEVTDRKTDKLVFAVYVDVLLLWLFAVAMVVRALVRSP